MFYRYEHQEINSPFLGWKLAFNDDGKSTLPVFNDIRYFDDSWHTFHRNCLEFGLDLKKKKNSLIWQLPTKSDPNYIYPSAISHGHWWIIKSVIFDFMILSRTACNTKKVYIGNSCEVDHTNYDLYWLQDTAFSNLHWFSFTEVFLYCMWSLVPIIISIECMLWLWEDKKIVYIGTKTGILHCTSVWPENELYIQGEVKKL